MLIVGIAPLLANLDISDIARAASIAANLPAFLVYWAIMKIPEAYPDRYQASIFAMQPLFLWSLYVFSQFATVVGVYFLAQDLPSGVISVLIFWLLASVCYYPARRVYLARQGIDLDKDTTDRWVFEEPSAEANLGHSQFPERVA